MLVQLACYCSCSSSWYCCCCCWDGGDDDGIGSVGAAPGVAAAALPPGVAVAVLLCFLFSRSQLNFSSFLSKKPPLLFQRCLAPFFLCFFPVPLSFVQKKLSPSFSFPALSLVPSKKNSPSFLSSPLFSFKRTLSHPKNPPLIQLLRAVFIGKGGAGKASLRMGSRACGRWSASGRGALSFGSSMQSLFLV